MQFWVRNHYRVLPTDPRWLALDDEQVIAIYLSHHYAENGVPNEVVDENFDENVDNIDELFGVEEQGQPAPQPEDEFEEVINDRRN
jgi:hypothetical protein